MGAILPESKENEILKLLRKDDARKLQEFIQLNQIPPEILLTNHKRTLLQLSCYYESPRCLSKLIEMSYDYNKLEEFTGDTPLFICSKFNNLEMVRILLAKEDCKKLVKNNENLNEFDIAFLKGNYDICYYMMYEYDKKRKINTDNEEKNDINNIINEKEVKIEDKDFNIINTNSKNNKEKKLSKENKKAKDNGYDINQIYQKYFYNTDFEYDYFLTLQAESKYPLFNMPLFFRCLCNKTSPSKCPSFAAERKKTLDLTTKIPDPNESWGHFFKRVANMELYNPPLVDKKNVSVMNSMYMNAQMKLMENEYGIKMGFDKRNEENGDDTERDLTKHPLDEDDSGVLQLKKVGKKKKDTNLNKKPEENEKKNEENGIEIDDVNEKDIEIKENNIENDDNDNGGNLCIIKINENSSERDIGNENKNE